MDSISILVVLAAFLFYINHHWLKLPSAIGIMSSSLILSLGVIASATVFPDINNKIIWFVKSIEFNVALMQWMLCFLLFAGSLQIRVSELHQFKFIIAALSILGVLISTFVFGTLVYFVFHLLALNIPYIWCLLLGALISPTDPVAVLALIRGKVSKSLEVKISGESLFNDGTGVVVFTIILGMIVNGTEIKMSSICLLFIKEAIGGAIIGFLTGKLAYKMIKSVDYYTLEILITIALVMGTSSLAAALHSSSPIAVVIAGLLIGSQGREFAMSDKTREHLYSFWELIDEVLNSVLFLLIGIEILVIELHQNFVAVFLSIPLMLIARYVSVYSIVKFSRFTWAYGGISVALALSLPKSSERELFIAITYGLVLFSILVQGLTLERLVRKYK